MLKKILIFLILLNFTAAYAIDSSESWFNGGVGFGDSQGGSLRSLTDSTLPLPSGTSLGQKSEKIWTPKMWIDGIKSGKVPFYFDVKNNINPKKLSFNEIKSYIELELILKKYKTNFNNEADVEIKKFLEDKNKNPVILYTEVDKKILFFSCSSNGKRASIVSDWFGID